jgi:hypothetical protein
MSSSTATARNRWAPMHDHHDLIFRSAQGNLNLQRLEPGSLRHLQADEQVCRLRTSLNPPGP